MKKQFVKTWKSSIQPRKQRKYRHNIPLHLQKKFVRSMLSKELRKKYALRNIGLKKGDKVKIVRGDFKGKTGKIERINLKKRKIYITGIEKTRKDGGKTFSPIEPSNVIIQELELKDARRLKQIKKTAEKKNEKTS